MPSESDMWSLIPHRSTTEKAACCFVIASILNLFAHARASRVRIHKHANTPTRQTGQPNVTISAKFNPLWEILIQTKVFLQFLLLLLLHNVKQRVSNSFSFVESPYEQREQRRGKKDIIIAKNLIQWVLPLVVLRFVLLPLASR